MNITMTNGEFHQAFSNTPFHYAPDGYWDSVNEQRKKHKFVGRKAFVYGRVHECIKAEDDLVFFKSGNNGEIIVSGDDVENIKWVKE